MNELKQQPNWFKRHWKGLLAVGTLVLLFVLSVPEGVGGNAFQIALGYTDTELCNDALEIARNNKRVKEALGTLEPIGKLAILEGHVRYTKEMDSVFMALTIKGSKGKGKLDFLAFKKGEVWVFQKIDVRLKEPIFRKETIPILSKSELILQHS